MTEIVVLRVRPSMNVTLDASRGHKNATSNDDPPWVPSLLRRNELWVAVKLSA